MTTESSIHPPKKSRRGCWISLFLSLALLAAALYYIIYHTAIPARYFVGQATEKDTFEAEDIGGSIASGKSTIGVMRFDTGAETMSEFYGFEITYPQSGLFEDGKILIESITYERVVLYLDTRNLPQSKKDPDTKRDANDQQDEKKESPGFRMARLHIPEVTLHVVDLGWNLEFSSGLTIDGLEASGERASVGEISLLGDAVRLEIPAFEATSEKGKSVSVPATITLTTALSPTIQKNIQIHLTLGFMEESASSTEITAFDSQFKTGTVPGVGNRWFLKAQNLTVGEYVSGWFPGNDLSIDAIYDSELSQFVTLSGGGFALDGQSYTFDPFENHPTNTLHATSQSGARLAIHFADGFAAPEIVKARPTNGAPAPAP